MTLVVGVDGGGTKTHAVVADDSGMRGLGISGPSNWEDSGFEAASGAIQAAVREALGEAGVDPLDVDGSVFGLAGIDFASDEERFGGVCPAIGMRGPCRVVNDSFVALRAGSNHPWGLVVVAGTGSVVAGRNRAGETFRTLGLGPMFGDDGSASEISAEAFGAVAAELLGRGPRTTLTAKLMERTETRSPEELIEAVARGNLNEARYADIVLECAEGGDLAARRILESAGASLGDRAGHVARRLRMEDEAFEVVLAGAIFRGGNRILRAAFDATLKRSARDAYPVTLEAPPVVGAVLLAMEDAGVDVDQERHAALAVAAIETMNGRRG